MHRILLGVLFALPVPTVFAQLSAPERDVVFQCEENVNVYKKTFSPAAADKCVKDLNGGEPEPLITKYSRISAKNAAEILGGNNALLDLNHIVANQEGKDLARALTRVLEKPGCALCALELGPRPEEAFDWVGKYSGGRLQGFKTAVRTWESLGDLRRSSLSADSMSESLWNSQLIFLRYCALTEWARKETVELEKEAALPAGNAARKAHIEAMLPVLREDLSYVDERECPRSEINSAFRRRLWAIEKKIRAAEADKTEHKPAAADRKAGELSAAAERLDGLSGGDLEDQNEYLSRAFDNSAAVKHASVAVKPAGAAAPKPDAKRADEPVSVTPEQEKALTSGMLRLEDGKMKGYLADVLRKTEAGRETAAFYEGPEYAKAGTNKLYYGFRDDPDGSMGYWDLPTKYINLNRSLATDFASERHLTVAQLLEDPAAMKDFAVYVSPTFIHESEHQEQAARAIEQGIDYKKYFVGSDSPYTRHKENLANGKAARHIVQYVQENGGAAALNKFHDMHAENAVKFMEGGLRELDILKAPLYPRIDSLSGGIAREANVAKEYARRLDLLEMTEPAALTDKQKLDMKEYRRMMDTRFKWYTTSYRENAEAEMKALAFRLKYGGRGVWSAAPPGLSEGSAK